jgi:hypothetical protein
LSPRYYFPRETFGANDSRTNGHIRPAQMQKNKASSYESSMSLFYPLLCMQTFTKSPMCNMTATATTCGGHLRHEPLHPGEVRAFLEYEFRDFIERYLESYSPSDIPAD